MTESVKKGQYIVVEGHTAGEAPRRGQVLEVMEHDYGTSYRVRWEDGHESTFQPVAGTVRVVDEVTRPGTTT